MKYIDKVPVPVNQDQDVNKESTIWRDGKCVALVEGRQTVAYLLHETEIYTNENGAEEIQAKAAEIRVDSPLTADKLLNTVKRKIMDEIVENDTSISVNSFFLSGKRMWLDKSTRSGLMLRLNAEHSAGKQTTILWYDGSPISLSVSCAISMLNSLELYASQCYDKTQDHISTVSSMTDPEQVLMYDYTEGYPEHLRF